MQLAFIILAHKNPAQLLRLLQRLQHPGIDCYIHLDAKCDMQDWQSLAALPQVYFVEDRANVTWAGFGTIQAALNGIAAVQASGRQYAFLHLISAQDYPLKSAAYLYDFCCAHAGRQFLNVLSPQALQRTMTKITQYHFEDLRLPGKYRLARLVNKILPPRRHPLQLEVYGGSLWWSLSQDCAVYCLQYIQQHPVLKRFYKYTWGGDEFIFQTIIMNSPFKDQVVNDHLRYIDWSEGKAHPKTFGLQDLDAIMRSGKLLARKFDIEQAPEVMDEIDKRLNRD